MPLATQLVWLMTFGLIAHIRARFMAAAAAPGTVVKFEAERAAGFSALLIILTTPWLLIAGLWLHFAR